jgi:hypothetical protein
MPRAVIAASQARKSPGNRHANLGSPREELGNPVTQALEQGQLRSIPDAATCRIGSGRQLQADHREDSCHRDKWQIGITAALDDADPGVGKPHRPANRSLAQIPRHPCIASLSKKVM